MPVDPVELLGEEVGEQVKDQLGDDYYIVEEENHVSKDSFDTERKKLQSQVETKEEKIEALEDQIEQRDNQIEQLKNDTQMTEELQEKVEKMQEQNEQLKEEKEELIQEKEQEIQQTLARERKAKAVEVALANKTTHSDLLIEKVNFDELEFDEDSGEVEGVNKVIENLQEQYDDLFIEETVEGPGELDSGNSPGPQKDPSEMTDAEYFKAVENGEIKV